MSDQSNIDPEKTRRPRSFSSFLIVLLVLLLVLMVVGGERFQQTEQLSQDLYEWHLHQGHVVSQKLKGDKQGTNLIQGYYAKGGDPRVPFEVRYTSLEGRDQLFRELKARRYDLISPEALLGRIEDGSLTPIEVRSLTGFRVEEPVAGPEGATEETVSRPRQVERSQKLLVTALPSGERARGESRSGYVYLDVSMEPRHDLAAVLATLETGGAKVENLTFDLSKLNGTRWEDSTNLFQWFLVYLGPWILLAVIFMIFLRQMRGQGGAGGVMSFGRSRAQLYSKESHTNTTFDDIAGAAEAKSEVRELVEFLKNPSRFTRIGGRIPRGVLLVGPPGCGKTLLAKAIAGEAEVPFFSISGSDFVEMFVGVGASRVRDLFKQARENSPCIIFLDEIDAVGRRRGSGMGGGHDEREQTLNAILVEMDGFGTDEGIIVIAATNRPDVLDPALLRPGRFDREVTIDLPDLEEREAILDVHLKRVKSEPQVDLGTLARSTPGYSGADLAAIINEAAIMAVLAKRDAVSMPDLEEARDKVRYGRQKTTRKIEEEDRRITAYHEAGHAIVAAVVEEIDPPHKVTIVPRGRALGATMVVPERESYHMQSKKLLGQLAMLFGGRVAEATFCGDISAGASDDIRRATDLARAMVTELGMSEAIGPINYAERQGSDFLGTELMRGKLHSEKTAREIDDEVHRILREAYDRATEIVTENRVGVEALAEGLLRYETIMGAEIERILDGESLENLRPAPEPESPPPPAERKSSDDRVGGTQQPGDLPGSPGLSPA